MNESFDAIYENGVFKPLQPVSLPEHAQVRVVVESTESNEEYHRQLAELREKLSEAEKQSAAGQHGPFNADETKQRLNQRLAQQDINE